MIRPYKEVYTNSLRKLKQYQSGELTSIVTGRPWLDDTFGGLLPGDVVTIGGASGAGKSFELQKLINNIFNMNNSEKFVCLMNSLEMKNLSTLLREFKIQLNKSKKSIITQEFTEEEQAILREYSKMYTDGRFFINEETTSADAFYKAWSTFLDGHTDKEAVVITFDHIALIEGGSKVDIDALLANINKIKGKYQNVIFILLTQLNRDILKRIAEKNTMSAPVRSDVYASDTTFFLSDHLYVINNASKLGINEYMKVNPEIYAPLSEHFAESETSRVSFLTYGKLFFHVLKSREADVIYQDIYIENLEVPKLKEDSLHETSNFSSDAFELKPNLEFSLEEEDEIRNGTIEGLGF